jgi:hypothetical protein
MLNASSEINAMVAGRRSSRPITLLYQCQVMSLQVTSISGRSYYKRNINVPLVLYKLEISFVSNLYP